jgi:hypothetical protein
MTLLNDMPKLAAADVRTDQPTRSAKLKWVVIVDRDLPPGPLANAVACLSASVGRAVPNLVGPGGLDASGGAHHGLPWLGCTVLAAPGDSLRAIRTRAAARDDLYLVDMAAPAQAVRVYDDYLSALEAADPADITYQAISVVGPRNPVNKLVGGLPLLR